jgi:hypothetical protein
VLSKMEHEDISLQNLDEAKVQLMLKACATGDEAGIRHLVQEHFLYARQQDQTTGKSPLMVAAEVGQISVVQIDSMTCLNIY